jgi:hypothetical protein
MLASLRKWWAAKTHRHEWAEFGRYCMVDGNLVRYRVYRCACGAEQGKAALLIAGSAALAEAAANVVDTKRYRVISPESLEAILNV